MEVHVLNITFNHQGNENVIHPVLLKNGKECILIDCGYPGFLQLIEEAANLQGIMLKDLTGIIVTHDDLDHVGGLYEFKAKLPSLKVYASAIEEPYISGRKKSLRLQQAEDMYHQLPEEQKQGALHFQELLKAIRPVEVNFTFSEEEELSFLPGAHVIFTPGHTPGHLSILIEDTKTIIAADALVIEDGDLEIANPGFTLDLPQAIESINKILKLKPNKLICYHGGIMEDNVIPKLKTLINKYQDFKKI